MTDHNSPEKNARRKNGKKIRNGWQYDVSKMRMVPLIEQRDYIEKAVDYFLANGGWIKRLDRQESTSFFFTTGEIMQESDEFLRGQ